RALFRVEFSGLVKDRVADAELADIVKQCSALKPAPPLRRERQLFRNEIAKDGYALTVSGGVRALGIDDLGESGGDVVQIVLIDDFDVLSWFQGKNCKSQIIGTKRAPKLGIRGNLIEHLGQMRVEPGARPGSHGIPRGIGAV